MGENYFNTKFNLGDWVTFSIGIGWSTGFISSLVIAGDKTIHNVDIPLPNTTRTHTIGMFYEDQLTLTNILPYMP